VTIDVFQKTVNSSRAHAY